MNVLADLGVEPITARGWIVRLNRARTSAVLQAMQPLFPPVLFQLVWLWGSPLVSGSRLTAFGRAKGDRKEEGERRSQ